MNKLKILKLKKLLKGLEYLEDNYTYTQEMISEADNDFMESVSSYLESNPNIKEVYNTKNEYTNKKILEEIKKNDNVPNNDYIEKKDKKEPSKDTKKIYRDIVKLTHPDKVNDEVLKQIYIDASLLYENDDIIGLYKICDKLNIEYKINENDIDFLNNKIKEIKSKISFLESTFTWKWLNSEDESKRNEIVLTFINMKIK